MPRNLIYFLPLLLIILFAAILAYKLSEKAQNRQVADFAVSEMVGKKLPEFSLDGLDGKKNSLTNKDLEGKFAILNVFASWCPGCIAEHHLFNKLVRDHGIDVYGINWKDSREAAVKMLRNRGNPYRKVGVDTNGIAAVNLGLTGIPETFLVDDKGIILFNYKGPLTEEIVESEIVSKIK